MIGDPTLETKLYMFSVTAWLAAIGLILWILLGGRRK